MGYVSAAWLLSGRIFFLRVRTPEMAIALTEIKRREIKAIFFGRMLFITLNDNRNFLFGQQIVFLPLLGS